MYGNIFVRKRKLLSKLEHVQKILDVHESSSLAKRELELRQEIEELLFHEELLWFQKSRLVWLRNGDRNTSYFHTQTLARQKQNKIEGLMVGNDWCFEEEVLRQHVVDFFQNLYSQDYSVDTLPYHGHFPSVSGDVINNLN